VPFGTDRMFTSNHVQTQKRSVWSPAFKDERHWGVSGDSLPIATGARKKHLAMCMLSPQFVQSTGPV
jgi:hypothetical protein